MQRFGLAVERSIAAAAAEGAVGLGIAFVRILDIADRLLEESRDWLAVGGKLPDQGDRLSANLALLERFEADLGMVPPPDPADPDPDPAVSPEASPA